MGKPRKKIEYVIDDNGCHICTSHSCSNGYPIIIIHRKKVSIARFLYVQKYDSIPDDIFVTHTCGNSRCINVEHFKLKDLRFMKGEHNPRSKLTDEQVIWIKQHLHLNTKELAITVNTTKATISAIRYGKQWAHILPELTQPSCGKKGVVGCKPKGIEYTLNDNGCHICTSHCTNKDGYPKCLRNGKEYIMSRYIYEQTYGEIPSGMIIRHKCDTPSCINPEHLVLGTKDDNAKDMVNRGRSLKGSSVFGSKLSECDVIWIKNNLHLKDKDIAKMFNVHRSNIRCIRIGKTWKHLRGNINE